jgi:hypothetical protein
MSAEVNLGNILFKFSEIQIPARNNAITTKMWKVLPEEKSHLIQVELPRIPGTILPTIGK